MSLANVLAEILAPAPGKSVALPDVVHAAIQRAPDVTVRFRDVRAILRTAGLRIGSIVPDGETHVFGVVLAGDVA